MARRRRNRKIEWKWLAFFPVLTILVLLSKCGHSEKPKETPQNVDTMVSILMSQTPTPTITPLLTDTSLPTATPTATFAPIPTDTPVSYDAGSWIPGAAEASYYDENTYYYSDGSNWTPNTEVPVAYENNNTCYGLIKGNVNPNKNTYVYHCPNGAYYNDTLIQPEQGDRWFCTELEAIAAGFHKPKGDPACGGF